MTPASFTDFFAAIAGMLCTPKVKRIGRITVTAAAVALPADVTDIAHSPLPFSGVISLPLSAQLGDKVAYVRAAPAFETAATVATWR